MGDLGDLGGLGGILDDDYISNLLATYIYVQYVIQGVTSVQRQFRRYLAIKALNQLIHEHMSAPHRYDIIEYSYAPPERESQLPLVRSGGFHYREAEREFNYLKTLKHLNIV